MTKKRALVLASSRGIGQACAKALARDGLEVGLNGRHLDQLNQAENEILQVYPDAMLRSYVADLNSPEAREQLVAQAGEIDVLVLNVGGPAVNPKKTLSVADWQAGYDSVFLPMADILERVLPGMMARGWGRVVMISSIAIKQPIPNLVSSGVFRNGLASLMWTRAQQAAQHNVTLNTILPGRILTDRQVNALTRDAQAAGITMQAHQEKVAATIPMKRLGAPDEVGHVCAFLCSDGASYVTGQNILVDGGAYKGMF